MEEWGGIRVYDEVGFDRKLRREDKAPLFEHVVSGDPVANDLIFDQLMDLIEGLNLTPRMKEVLRLKVSGWSLREIAHLTGVSRQRTERIWSQILRRLPNRLTEIEAQMVPGSVPHYGWQEVYLETLKG
jgi:DNA-directed RNA polymerase specialized sigma subunit